MLCVLFSSPSLAKKKHRKRHLTPITNPLVLWARTLTGSTDAEEKKRAAFKFSQYTQTIYQEEAIRALLDCLKEQDITLRVLCTKALGKAGSAGRNESIRKALLETFKNDPVLKMAITNTFIKRKDLSKETHDTLLASLKNEGDSEVLISLLSYFEQFGQAGDMDAVIEVYQKSKNVRVRRGAIKTLSERSQGQDAVVDILAGCSLDKDTPLALNCLSGLQAQARSNPKAITAVEKTIMTGDPDVLLSTMDVINVFPEQPSPTLSKRLIEIIEGSEDPELTEKAVLSLGVVGNQSEALIATLTKTLKNPSLSEGIHIASALVLGKQAVFFPDEPKQFLNKCKAESASLALRKACQLGLQDLEARLKSAPKPSPILTPSSEAKP